MLWRDSAWLVDRDLDIVRSGFVMSLAEYSG